VQIVYYNKGAACEIELGDDWRVNLHDDLIRSLSDWLEPENVRIVYAAGTGIQHANAA
jgi:DNA polymerase-3 subunit alpha